MGSRRLIKGGAVVHRDLGPYRYPPTVAIVGVGPMSAPLQRSDAMNHGGSHQGHMWLIGAVALVVLLAGYGIGSALAVAVIACAVMLGSIIWYVRRSEVRPQRHDAHRNAGHRH